MSVAVVGTGRMGAAMGRRLRDAGHRVVAYNRSRARAEKLGVAVADTPREAVAGADAIVVSLADDAAVGSVYGAADGLVAGLSEGAVVLETSTVHPDTIRGLAPLVAGRGAALLDTPVAFMLDLVAKDLALIDDLAGGVGARMDQLAANRAVVAAAIEAGYGTRDLSAIAEYLRR